MNDKQIYQRTSLIHLSKQSYIYQTDDLGKYNIYAFHENNYGVLESEVQTVEVTNAIGKYSIWKTYGFLANFERTAKTVEIKKMVHNPPHHKTLNLNLDIK